MAEEKEYEPTQSRIERAKREGDVARSQELAGVAAFGAGLLAVIAVAGPIAVAAQTALRAAVSGRIDGAALASVAFFMLVPATCAGCAAATCGLAQSGGLHVVAVTIKAERISPSENLKRIFSRESAVTVVRASVAFACAGAAIIPAFMAIYGASLHAAATVLASAAWSGALRAAGLACGVGALFAAADYGVQAVRWRRRLRMSLEELKRDRKEQDGDPVQRGRRRALHRQLSRESLTRVKSAAFVVTNPTHIAIALEYRPPDVPVPRVLVRAADEAAARVREAAGAHGIPLVENVMLARRLYASVKPGEFIPQETYIAVAEIVAALRKTGVLRA